MRGELHLLLQLHVAGICDSADAEEQQHRAEELVERPAGHGKVRAGVGREDPSGFGD